MRNILTLVLGGGRGTRLFPLTKYRSKPAVPLAGKYRLIDIPLSNCINSGLNRVYVMTQFNSVSLHRHIRRTYIFDAYSGGFVEILAAQQTLDNEGWYQGTADAVRQHIRYLQQPGIDYVLILSGDQLYRMNYMEMLATHQKAKADVTIAAMPVARKDASALGIMHLTDSGRVDRFLEKPKTDEELKNVRMSPEWIEKQGVDAKGRDLMASMGIYLFNRDVLIELLTKTDYRDFGKEIFPTSIRTKHVQMHMFDGYWEDIGTIKSFYQCNIDLAHSNPPFELASALEPIYTRARFLPPSRIEGATIRNSLVSDGCVIGEGTVIESSVIGLRCKIGKNVTIRNSIIMGSDEYDSPRTKLDVDGHQQTPWGIGDGTLIQGAIVDKNCRIGRNVRVVNERAIETSEETPEYMICDGIIVVQKDACLPDGWRMK